jgi:hypothetical protein
VGRRNARCRGGLDTPLSTGTRLAVPCRCFGRWIAHDCKEPFRCLHSHPFYLPVPAHPQAASVVASDRLCEFKRPLSHRVASHPPSLKDRKLKGSVTAGLARLGASSVASRFPRISSPGRPLITSNHSTTDRSCAQGRAVCACEVSSAACLGDSPASPLHAPNRLRRPPPFGRGSLGILGRPARLVPSRQRCVAPLRKGVRRNAGPPTQIHALPCRQDRRPALPGGSKANPRGGIRLAAPQERSYAG